MASPHTTKFEHVTMTWITSICQFLHRTDSWVEIRGNRVIEVQRMNYRFIMQLALDGNYNLKLIQQCRLWLRIVTMADICDPAGRKIES